MKKLAARLQRLSKKQPFRTGWYLKHIPSGKEAGFNAEKVFPSASVRKIFILMAALRDVHEQKISLNQPVKILKKYQNNRSGVLQHLSSGFTITLHDALVMMIIVSDNTCTGTVVNLVGLKRINAYIRSLNLQRTQLLVSYPPLGKENRPTAFTTPREVGYILDLILAGSREPNAAGNLGCTPSLCKMALDILSWQKFNNKLPAQLPLGTKVAHKTGTRKGVNNDAGIIYRSGKPLFILSVFTEKVPPELDGVSGKYVACEFIAKLSRMCWDGLN